MNQSLTRIAGVVLAGGMSRRFGTNKLLAKLGDKPLIRIVTEAALASNLARLFVVLGHEANRVGVALDDDPRLQSVINPDFATGQASTVTAGLRATQGDFNAVMFLMGDQPLLGSAIINALIDTFQASDKEICYPSHGGKRRNPVIFDKCFFPEILSLTGDTGARAIIDANPDRACVLEQSDAAPFRDVDRESDLAALIGEPDP
ncbi:MAG: nucleotidyltransferase family protein [Rhodospirillales bacterium]|jgi:molybdenum cofactor cytidylyltransferase|nr:nucleotidyltransferase family protein [Rhodospirillales bacterium]